MRTPLLAIAASVMLCGVAQAKTLDVCPTGCTYSSIQDAIDASSDGDEILVGQGTYTSTQDGHVVDMKGKAITLRSTDGPDMTIIDGEGARRGIACFNGETDATVIEGFTITNGDGVEYDYNGDGGVSIWETYGGGMYIYGSSPTLNHCIIKNNVAEYYAGGVLNNSSSSPTLTYCTFENNAAPFGGGMQNFNSSPTLVSCTFTDNTSLMGGGMNNDFDSNPTLTNCLFSSNTAANTGGGMRNLQSSPVLNNCTFANNNSVNNNGGGMSNSQSGPVLTGCVFTGNSSNKHGGGMFNTGSGSSLTDCLFSNNTASQYGGGMYNINGSSTRIMDSSFCENDPSHIEGDWVDEGGNEFLDVCTVDCIGDININGTVDVLDLLLVINFWGSDGGTADVNFDHTVDVLDLLLVIGAWGPCP